MRTRGGERILLVVQASTHGREQQMLHWKAKLAYLLVAAAVLASFLGEAEGWHW